MTIRPCIVCQHTQSTEVFNKPYHLTGLGEVALCIKVCDNCGAVYQNPLPDQQKIRKTYSEMSNYTNPGRDGKPSATKIAALDRQLAYLSKFMSPAGRAFQVGCSDGYTLHRFQQAGWEVDGIDPSSRAIALAKKQYDLDINEGFIEDFDSKGVQYNLIILTHVLEHFVDPKAVLLKCLEMLEDDGYIFIEVPSLIDEATWPTSYFTFEHLAYFSPISMINLMKACGIEPLGPVFTDLTEKDPYPIQMCHGRKGKSSPSVEKDQQALAMCQAYVTRDVARWQEINHKIDSGTAQAKSIAIWGGGVHTAQLLEETNLLERFAPITIVDSDPQKWGKSLYGITIAAPSTILLEDPELAIVISSFVFEQEIKQTLEANPNLRACIITLYS
ncbi:class I SAM-dependent methyltransferase [Shewanella marisflavi]|uniref:class I SAM-dependent methyltransferase n=1 Tax=Shewanella marisflavi TaxID=260364 RepID=UPI003AAC4731